METLAHQIFDIAREIRGPNDEGRLMFNTLYDIGEQVAALTAEIDRLRAALAEIGAGLPAPPGGKWLSDAKMAQIARKALEGGEK